MANPQLPAKLRKAAILISTLDDRTADALLDQMGPEQAQRVRDAIMQLDDIPDDEQQQVIAEFLGRGNPNQTPSTSGDDGVELSESLVRQLEQPNPQPGPSYASLTGMNAGETSRRPANRQPFEFLRNVDSGILARLLGREHPQTIAVVMAHLPPEQVAEILAALPAETSIEALGRMARLDELVPEVLEDLERELEARLPHMATARLQPQGVASIQAVLDALDQSRRAQLLEKLGEKDARLLRRLGYTRSGENPFEEEQRPRTTQGAAPSFARFPWDAPQASTTPETKTDPQPEEQALAANASAEQEVDLTNDPARSLSPEQRPPQEDLPRLQFEHFNLISDAALNTIVEHADAATLELALTGADARIVRRVLRLLPVREAARWRQRLERPSPLRLRDIELAREALARLAMRLARQGEITLPNRLGFAAAA